MKRKLFADTVCESVLCLFQWYYVWRILKGEFSDQEILEAYQKKDKPQAS